MTKATSDDSTTSGSCVLSTPSGTVLDSDCPYSSGKINSGSCFIDCSKLDSTKQVESKCKSADGKVVSTLFDATSCSAVSSIDAGTCDASSTTTHLLTYNSLDSNCTPDNKTEACKSKISSDADLKKMFAALKEQLNLGSATGTFGTSDGNQAIYSTFKALRECIANVSGCDFSKMASELSSGFPASKGFVSGAGSTDWSVVASLGPNVAATYYKFFADSTTAGKWTDSTAIKALAKSLGAYGSGEYTAFINNPANARGLYNKYADAFNAGSTTAFDPMSKGGRSFGEFLKKFGTANMDANQAKAAKALFDSLTYGTDNDKLGASCYAQIKACDSETECNSIANNPTHYAGLILKDPSALASDDGSIAQGWLNQFGTAGTFVGITPCSSNSNCPGQICSSATHFCVASSVAGLGNGSGPPGSVCSANADCQTCNCIGGFCAFASSGLNFFGYKFFGQTCSNSAECFSGSCSSGACACTLPPPTPVTLASNLANVRSMQCNTNECFWIENNTSATDGKVCKVSVSGGAANCFMTGLNQPREIVLCGSNVFMGNGPGDPNRVILKRAIDASGSNITVASGNGVFAANLTACDDTNLYMGNGTLSPGGAMQKILQTVVNGDSSSFSNIVTGLNFPGAPSLGGSNLYFQTSINSFDDIRGINCVTTGGSACWGGAVLIATASAQIRSLPRPIGTNLCWADGTGGQTGSAVRCIPIGGGTVVTLASGLLSANSLAASGGFIYFGGSLSASQGGILKISTSAINGTPTVYTSLSGFIGGTQIVGSTIYFLEYTDQSTVTATIKKIAIQ